MVVAGPRDRSASTRPHDLGVVGTAGAARHGYQRAHDLGGGRQPRRHARADGFPARASRGRTGADRDRGCRTTRRRRRRRRPRCAARSSSTTRRARRRQVRASRPGPPGRAKFVAAGFDRVVAAGRPQRHRYGEFDGAEFGIGMCGRPHGEDEVAKGGRRLLVRQTADARVPKPRCGARGAIDERGADAPAVDLQARVRLPTLGGFTERREQRGRVRDPIPHPMPVSDQWRGWWPPWSA